MAINRSAPPILAAILLLLPWLYVGSYLALVVPARGTIMRYVAGEWNYVHPYRYGGAWSAALFRPLEKMDRKLRAESWKKLAIQLDPAVIVPPAPTGSAALGADSVFGRVQPIVQD